MITLLVPFAAAHHPVAVSRVSAETSTGAQLEFPEHGLRVDAGGSVDVAVFDKTKQGSRTLSRGDGAVIVTENVQVGLQFPSRTAVSTTLPIAEVVANQRGSIGLGDVSASVTQGLSAGSSALTVSLGGSAPTGRSAPDTNVGVIDVTTDDEALLVTVIDTRTQPGLGAWAVDAGATGVTGFGATRLVAAANARVPVTATADGAIWGTDLSSQLGVQFELPGERVRLGASAVTWAHLVDRLPSQDGWWKGSRRQGAALSPSITVAIGTSAICSAQVQVPVWQHVDGTQLTHSIQASTGCVVVLARIHPGA